MNPIVAIVLVNYNGWIDTIECLESLIQQKYSAFSITIVDNASSDDSVQNINEWAKGNKNLPATAIAQPFFNGPAPKPICLTILQESEIQKIKLSYPKPQNITLIKSDLNRGFAGGNNLATEFIFAQNVKVPYIWYLNNDTVVQKNALLEMIKDFEEQVRKGINLGIMGAKLMYYHNPGIIQAIGGIYNKWYGTSRHLGCNEPDQGQYDKNPEQASFDYIVGASMLVSRKFLDKVGLMSTDYFLYYEEMDWIIRGKHLDFTFAFCPRSVVYHKEGRSTGGTSKYVKKSYVADFYSITNRLVFTNRYFPLYRFPVYLTLIGVIFNRIKRGQFSRVKIILDILFKSLFSSFKK